LIIRIISAAIIVAFVLTAVYLDFRFGTTDSLGRPGLVLVPLVLALAGMAAHELTTMIASRNPSTPKSVVISGAIITVAFACIPALWKEYPANCPVGKLGWNSLGLSLAIAGAILFEMSRFKAADRVIANLAYSIFVIVYIGFMMAFLPSLRFLQSNEIGLTALLSLLFVVKFSDAGAYFVGKTFGRRKLAPKMSPGKSVAGAFGAIATGLLSSYVFFQLIAPRVSGGQVQAELTSVLIFGVVIAMTGMIGDLFESIIKRDFKAKDSSNWLPGLGGVLDIFDSILAAAPAAYIFWVAGFFSN
jgi:phosphatidate cytidylyltransferase